jgi:hypothetical protein
MKRNIVRTFLLAAFLLSLAAVTLAQPQRICSNAELAGSWGSTLTGTQILPTGSVPFAAVSRTTYDFAGNLWGTQTRTSNGNVSRVTFQGTCTVNPDCTGTKTIRSFDQSGNLINTATVDFVLVSSAKEVVEVFTSITLPNGVTVPVVITGRATKLYEWEYIH